ncbi:MAG: hypothetical protein WAZ14_03295 [Patescibacteria group bacterium]
MEKHPLHLKNSGLQTSPEVQRAVQRQEQRTDEKIPNDPKERIEAYVGRLENVFLNPDERIRERNLEMFRPNIYAALLTKKENFPESYFELQQRIARERGQAVEEIPDNVREQMKDVAITDQRHSLDAWIDYLSSNDAMYPPWFKLFIWQNITKLSQFDKERGEFKKRTKSTVAPFPDIYREPLARIADVYEQVKKDNQSLKDEDVREVFSKQFPALYAEFIQESLAASLENRENTLGQWVKYEQGDGEAAETLFTSLEGKGTGWCTAGRSTAAAQIESGDFHVYYTNDASGTPAQPRLAIRMVGTDYIGEVRGTLPSQGVEPVMQEVLDIKLNEFGPEADAYRKKSQDMRRLTELDEKMFIRDNQGDITERLNPTLKKQDLLFLYEINAPIKGFGYEKDPRVFELRNERNPDEDMPIIFDCPKEQIARNVAEIDEYTWAYVGPLEAGIFDKLPEHIEHIYTSFPEGKIRREHIEIGDKTSEELRDLLTESGVKIGDYADFMMNSPEFMKRQESEIVELIRLKVRDLGLFSRPTTDQIYARIGELGLELCPAEVGPRYRLIYKDQPVGEYIAVGMKPIIGQNGYPFVFSVGRRGDGSWLNDSWARPDEQWNPDHEFLFRLRKEI